MICKYCGTMLPDGSQFCGNCGMKQEPERPKKKSRAGIVIGCFAAFFLTTIILGGVVFKVFSSIAGIDDLEKMVGYALGDMSEAYDQSDSQDWDFNVDDYDTDDNQDDSNTNDSVVLPVPEDFCEVTASNRELLGKLNNDYKKLNWTNEYQVAEDTDIVISVAKCERGGSLFIGITNLYSVPIMVDAEGKMLDDNGNEVGDVSFTAYAIGSGDTYAAISFANGEGVPSGDIKWTKFEFDESRYSSSSWSGDYELKSQDDGSIILNAKCKNTGSKKANMGLFSAMMLDNDGNIIYYTCEALDVAEPQVDFDVECNIYLNDEEKSKIKDVAIFMNPIVFESN